MKDIQYYITPPHQCSYIEGRAARMVFLDPVKRIDTVMLSELSRQGFRRSGDFIYRPECHHCRQCLSARINVQRFKINSSQKKALKVNRDLRMVSRETHHATAVHYHLYERYIRLRHADGDMYPPSREQFEKFLVESCTNSFFLEMWHTDQLMSVATCDQLDDGLSAVYTFFEPEQPHRSLGTFSILKQIEWAKVHNLPYVYLGYWVPNAAKMKYKAQFSGLEILLNGRWTMLPDHLTEEDMKQLSLSLARPLPEFSGR
ncbi:arginyltransferase [Alkanindiges sp. WGS2144]|uniref:arginyltransferase n=1 Tax=Alkanindiges sp. WGS2144 TaxID=3366808 RepID=UPI003751278D